MTDRNGTLISTFSTFVGIPIFPQNQNMSLDHVLKVTTVFRVLTTIICTEAPRKVY